MTAIPALLAFLAVLPVWAGAPAPARPELVVYAYDSLLAKDGLGQEIFSRFERRCDCKVRAISVGDGSQLLARVQLDQRRGKSVAHVMLGLDQQIWERAKPWAEDWGGWIPRGYAELAPETKLGPGFLPFDRGYFAWMVDRFKLGDEEPAPASLKALLDPMWKRRLLLQDPRTSTPGLAFLLYTRAVMGAEGSIAYWKKLRSQWLTLAPGWDQAYGLFLKGEAPLVWSYTTSQAYHRENGDAEKRYRALVFEEGQPEQIEGAALIKGAFRSTEERRRAERFLELLISEEIQGLVPRKNWMLPVRKGVALPAGFNELPVPRKVVRLATGSEEVATALRDWALAVEAGQ